MIRMTSFRTTNLAGFADGTNYLISGDNHVAISDAKE